MRDWELRLRLTLSGSPKGYQLFSLTDFVNIAFCSRKAYVGRGLLSEAKSRLIAGSPHELVLRATTRVAPTFPLTTLCRVVMIIS
jgi:hypothetical protein